VGEQQLEMAVVGAELAVVQRLPVVRVGPGVEQHASKCLLVRMPWLIPLATTQGAGESGER
jgi:hypothetical protein